jgi:hypothetical protein
VRLHASTATGESLSGPISAFGTAVSLKPTNVNASNQIEKCPIFATPRVETASTPEEVAADVDVQCLGGARIFVESTRLLPFGDNKITPFLTNVSFDVAAIC